MKKIKLCLLFIFGLFCASSFSYGPPPPLVTPVEKYTPPALTEKDSWTMVLVPDTQAYVKNKRNHGICDMMYCWIAENVENMKIQQVIQLGDLVDINRSMRLGTNNQTGPQQWKAISKIHERLDGIVPYILNTGNHDYGETSAQDRHTYFNDYFKADRNSKLSGVLVEQGPNFFGQHTLENAAYEFTTPNGQKILIVSLAFSPTDTQINWAKSVFNRKKFKNHFGILTTHAYMTPRGRIQKQKYAVDKIDGNCGEHIFQKLVKSTPNIRMVFCGHYVGEINHWAACVGFKISKNDFGKEVYEMLFDTQALAGGWSGNGGDGWIRLLEFSGDMKKVKVRTFSPLFAISPSTQHLAWYKSPFNEFEFEIKD